MQKIEYVFRLSELSLEGCVLLVYLGHVLQVLRILWTLQSCLLPLQACEEPSDKLRVDKKIVLEIKNIQM